MKRFLVKTFVTLALLLSFSEVASGGTVKTVMQLDGAATEAILGEVSQGIDQSSGICTITVIPAEAYSVESVTAIKITNGENAQSRLNAPAVNVPVEVTAGDVENTWYFLMPIEEYDVEVTVNFTIRTFGLSVNGVEVTALNMTNVLENGTVIYDSEVNMLTLNSASIMPEMECPGIDYMGERDLTIMLIGTSRVQGGGGCEAIRTYFFEGSEACKLVFTTGEDNPGKLICPGEGLLFDEFTNVEYQNSLALRSSAEGPVIRFYEEYNLWVKGTRVTNENKDNIMGDANATVRFNPVANILSLFGANVEITDSTTMIRSALPALTVDLRGINKMKFNKGFVSMLTSETASLTFTTNEEEPGQLSWETYVESGNQPVFAVGFDVSCEAPLRDFSVCEAEKLISVVIETIYDLLVGTTPVTSTNCIDILSDGGTVKYVADDQMLVLDNANLNIPIVSHLTGGLGIYLIGSNFMSGKEDLISTSVNNALIAFTTSDTAPGSLTLTKTEDTGTWISGFSAASVPSDYATTTDGNKMAIARVVPISPIITETENGEQPLTEEPTGGFGEEAEGEDADTYLNVVVNNVLYTLKAGDYNEGNDEDPEDPAGVNLTEVPEDMDEVLNETPGSDDYANAFKGLTIEVPAGNGQVMVTGEIGPGAKLAVKIGNNDPVLFPNDEYPAINQLETLYIPYSCAENTYVYIYLAEAASAPARAESPFHGRVLSGHIKISNVGASSSLVVNTNAYSNQTNTVMNRVIAYAVPSSAKTADNHGIVMSTVEVELSAASARSVRRATEMRKITELGTSVFDNVEKDQILYIDLSGTDIKDLTVNRNSGLFDGFGQNALFYLPAGNDDGGEDNVILGDNCARLRLVDDMDFRAPKDFNAMNAELVRNFTPGKTSTVFLPFALAKDQADALGTFHTFKAINGADAVFNEAEAVGTSANKPYIFVPAAPKVEAQNVVVESLDAFSVISGNMVGTYEKLVWADEQPDIYTFTASELDEEGAGQFVRVNAGEWLPPFQAYMKVNSTLPQLNLVVDGIITTLSPLSSLLSPLTWYTLGGQRLSGKPAVKGLYICNGKKVCVK